MRGRKHLTIIPEQGNIFSFGAIWLLTAIIILGVASACTLRANNPFSKSLPSPTATKEPLYTATPSITPSPTVTPTPKPAVRIENAEKAFFIGDWETTINEFQNALEFSTDPDVISSAKLGLGKTYFFAGNYHEAINTLESLVNEYPDFPHLAYAYFFLGRAKEAIDQPAEAKQAYQQYLALRPGIIDGYILEMQGDNALNSGDYANAASLYQKALNSPDPVDEEWINLKIARALSLSDDYQNALNLYEEIYDQTNNNQTKSLIHLREGQIYATMGEFELAMNSYSEAVTNFPTSYNSYSALVEIVEAEAPVDELQRGIVDYYAQQYGVALAALDRYMQNNPEDPATALYFSGLAYRASGNYQNAISQWEKITKEYPEHTYWDDAWEQMAYTRWAYLDEYTLAIENLREFVSLVPDHPRAAEFLFDAASIAEQAGKLELAAELWGKTATTYPDYERAKRAIFLKGITLYRLGDYPRAMAAFQMLSLEADTLEDLAAALLWMGKVDQIMGDENGAVTYWEQAANTDPSGYYSERARDLMRGREPFQTPVAYDLATDQAKERAQAEEWLRTTFQIPAGTNFQELGELGSNPSFLRANEFWNLGLYNQARIEFENLRQSLKTDPLQSYRLMNHLVELGFYRSAIFTARQILDLAGMDDASTLTTAPVYFNHIRFGPYYAELVIPIADEYNLHPLFLFSVIRQESLFESFIRSSAAASGLMQIIPSTGAEIASNIGWPSNYSVDDLARPLVNIRFGTYYLDKQRNIFSGDLYTALAAYNGGPGNAREWKQLAPRDLDLFLEVIRYPETRDYIKHIYEIFTIYNRLYNRSP